MVSFCIFVFHCCLVDVIVVDDTLMSLFQLVDFIDTQFLSEELQRVKVACLVAEVEHLKGQLVVVTKDMTAFIRKIRLFNVSCLRDSRSKEVVDVEFVEKNLRLELDQTKVDLEEKTELYRFYQKSSNNASALLSKFQAHYGLSLCSCSQLRLFIFSL